MKHVLSALVLVILLSEGVVGQNVAPPGNNRRPRADVAIADAVQGMFIAQFQEQVQVSDDQYVRILPILRQGIDSMRTNSNRSLNAFNQLRVMIRRNAPDDNINAQIQELDEANRQTKAAQEAFIANVDPSLSVPQRARFRVFLNNFNQRLRDLVERARQLNQNQRRPQ